MGLTQRRRARRAAVATLLLAALGCGGGAVADTDTASGTVAGTMGEVVDGASAALPTVRVGALTVSQVVAPAPIADAPMALYAAIANGGAEPDTLLAVEVAGGTASLHETAGGAMRPVARLPIPAGGAVALRPGGLHAMVELANGIAEPVVPGDTLRATLRFARAGAVAVAAPVVAYEALERLLGDAPAGAHAGH